MGSAPSPCFPHYAAPHALLQELGRLASLVVAAADAADAIAGREGDDGKGSAVAGSGDVVVVG